MQADARFFTDLVQRLTPILEAKGFRLTRHVYMPKSFGHRIATFEGPAFIVDAAWEGRDREILLLQRQLDQSMSQPETTWAGLTFRRERQSRSTRAQSTPL